MAKRKKKGKGKSARRLASAQRNSYNERLVWWLS